MIDDQGHPQSPTSTEPGASTNLGDVGESRFSEFFAGRWYVWLPYYPMRIVCVANGILFIAGRKILAILV